MKTYIRLHIEQLSQRLSPPYREYEKSTTSLCTMNTHPSLQALVLLRFLVGSDELELGGAF